MDGTEIVGNLISILPPSLVGPNSLCRLEWGPKAEAKSLLVCPGWLACKCEVCSRNYNAVWNTSVGTPYLNKLCAYCLYYAYRCSSMPSRMIMHHLQRANRAKVFKQQSAKSVKSASTENAIKAHFYRRDCNYLYLGAQVIHLQVIPPWIEAGLGEITYVQVCRKMANNCWSKTIHHDENQAWSLIISAIPLLAKKCQSWLYLSPWLWFLGTNLHWFFCTAVLSSPFEWALCNPSIRFV